MAEEKVVKMAVTALKEGTVIDHVPAGQVFKVVDVMNLYEYKKALRIGMYLDSKTYGKKDILKIEDRYLTQDEANMIALIAPNATINIIKDWKVAKKIQVSVPDVVTGLRCGKPRCITRYDKIKTVFSVLDKKTLKVRCHYCEHVFGKEEVI